MDEITSSNPPPVSLPFRRPADYYSTPAGDRRPIFPRWVPFGCGAASIVLLFLVFLGGVFAVRGGMGQLLDLMFASMDTEISKLFTKDVTAGQKAAFESEMKALREGVRQNRIHAQQLQPLLRTMREVIEDEHVTPAETDALIKQMHAVNAGGPKPAAPR